MKNYHLFLTLTAGVIGLAAIDPWGLNSKSTQPFQSLKPVQVAESSSRRVNLQTAQAIATKVTVLLKAGEGFGSGVLLGKKDNTYLILTSAHVVAGTSEIAITVQTPDGQDYPVRKVKNIQVGKFDLALLEFTSTYAYDVAKIAASPNKVALAEGNELFAAGFAFDTNKLKVVPGAIEQLPQKPFANGTQIGYETKGDIEQGMSGGPILDSSGNLIGINSTLAYPIQPKYTYANGQKAPQERVVEYQQANWGVPIHNLLTKLNPTILSGYKQLPKLHRAVTLSGKTKLDRSSLHYRRTLTQGK